MRYSVDTSSLAYALVRLAAPAGAAVESSALPDTVSHLPAVIVSASAPGPVDNDPRGGASARFTLSFSAYAESRSEASELCDQVYAGILAAWRDRIRTDYGWISRVLVGDVILPQPVSSNLEADDLHRFDAVVPVIARH